MDIGDGQKLWLVVLFVVPGFIGLKFHDLLSPQGVRRPADQVIDAIAYSCINYALMMVPIFAIEQAQIRQAHPMWYAAFYAFVLLFAPLGWTSVFVWLRKTQFFQGSMPHPTLKPWDFVFSQRRSFWVIVTLKDGTRIGGLYGDQSFASSLPAREQLYLEQTWVINDDGGFERARHESAGILILADEITTVELFNS
jgi:hypothetical protein